MTFGEQKDRTKNGNSVCTMGLEPPLTRKGYDGSALTVLLNAKPEVRAFRQRFGQVPGVHVQGRRPHPVRDVRHERARWTHDAARWVA
jgi:hypothetical protein